MTAAGSFVAECNYRGTAAAVANDGRRSFVLRLGGRIETKQAGR
jgi:hypothetical protein